ncbi:hypothetical protein M0804_013715 [Polistes exclamans]|nr:hypothetical protein M0804_013715 [Polistes exclamans]
MSIMHPYWMQCPSQETNATMHDGDVQDGTKLPALAHLIYTCNSGYQLNSSGDVFCDPEGNWLIFQFVLVNYPPPKAFKIKSAI